MPRKKARRAHEVQLADASRRSVAGEPLRHTPQHSPSLAQGSRTARLLACAQAAVTDSMSSAPKLSIVVVTYRRGETLEHCLDDLAAQDTREPFEVVVVMQAYPA